MDGEQKKNFRKLGLRKASNVVSGDGTSDKSRALHRLLKAPNLIKIAAGCVLLAAVVFVAGRLLVTSPDAAYFRGKIGLGPKIAARINKTLVKKSDVNKLSKQGKTSYDHTLTLLVDIKRYEEIGRQSNFKPTEKDIKDATEEIYATAAELPHTSPAVLVNLDDYRHNVILKKAWENAVAQRTTGSASGHYFEFLFTRYLDSPFSVKRPLTGNKNAIEADKVYAKATAEKAHERLRKGEKPETIIAELKNDERLIGAGTPNRTGSFDASKFNRYIGATGIPIVRQTILKEVRAGLTPVTEGGVNTDNENRPIPLVPEYYFFAKVDNVVGQHGEGWYEKIAATVKVKRYE